MNLEHNHIFNELFCMFKKPWSIGFSLYFTFIIVIINGLGVLCAFKYSKENLLLDDISQNLSIYSIAIFAPSLITLFLQLVKGDIHNKVSFCIISIAIAVGAIFVIPVAYQGNICFAILYTIISWFYWIIANRDNEYLDDESFDRLINKETKEHGNGWNNN